MGHYQLMGQHVRVVWREFAPRMSNQVGATIFRGQVAQVDEQGLWLWGRFFNEKADTRSIREQPKEKDGELKMFFGPWLSIESVQIISEDSKDYEVHQLVMSRKSDTPPPAL